MNVEKKEHPQYDTIPDSLGKWQYIYTKDDIEISLIELKDSEHHPSCWEIYQLKGESLFDDVERFETKEEAVQRIEELIQNE